MKVLFLDNPLKISLIPRKYPLPNAVLTLTLRKEIDDTILTPAFTFTVGDKLELTITTQPIAFKVLDKFDFELKNGSEVIYLGKIQILKNGTNTQNFEYGSQNQRFQY